MSDDVRAAILEFVSSRTVSAFLLTTQKSGLPYSVQITPVVAPDFSVRIRTNGASLKAGQVRRNGSVAVLFVDRTEGVPRNVLIQGKAVVSADKAEVDQLFDDLSKVVHFQINRDSPIMANSNVIKIAPSFLRAEGFLPDRFGQVYTEGLG